VLGGCLSSFFFWGGVVPFHSFFFELRAGTKRGRSPLFSGFVSVGNFFLFLKSFLFFFFRAPNRWPLVFCWGLLFFPGFAIAEGGFCKKKPGLPFSSSGGPLGFFFRGWGVQTPFFAVGLAVVGLLFRCIMNSSLHPIFGVFLVRPCLPAVDMGSPFLGGDPGLFLGPVPPKL